jgi:hypothetical protein
MPNMHLTPAGRAALDQKAAVDRRAKLAEALETRPKRGIPFDMYRQNVVGMMERKIGKSFPNPLIKKMFDFEITDYPTITAFLETIVEIRGEKLIAEIGERRRYPVDILLDRFTRNCTKQKIERSKISAAAGLFIRYQGINKRPSIDRNILKILKQ